MILAQRLKILAIGEWSFCFRLFKNVLTEVRHLEICFRRIESNQLFQRTNRRRCSEGREVSVEIGFELEQQHFKLRVVKLAGGRNVGGANGVGSKPPYVDNRVVH